MTSTYWGELFFESELHEIKWLSTKEAARQFLMQHPACPYSIDELCDDYRRRI